MTYANDLTTKQKKIIKCGNTGKEEKKTNIQQIQK